MNLKALNFFAGSGLVDAGLQPEFQTIWANDVSSRKASVFRANHPQRLFSEADIRTIDGRDLPVADLAWASFPCQDLSLAGERNGMADGTRSGLFWEWLRVIDELTAANRRPPVLVAENVIGFLTCGKGQYFRAACEALRARGFRFGAVVVDARLFVPQSRPRCFLIAATHDTPFLDFAAEEPEPPFHSDALKRAAAGHQDWIWWRLPSPPSPINPFRALCDLAAPCDSPSVTGRLCELLSDRNQAKLDDAIARRSLLVGTGYRRTRRTPSGDSVQRLEIRFDGLAGCLRTPEGGSSRQIVLIVEDGVVRSRLMTARECARLMGADDSYALPGLYNDAYRAMGDAVAVPVTRWLTTHLLAPLARR